MKQNSDMLNFKEIISNALLSDSKVRENKKRILLTVNDLPSENVTYEFETLLPFFYKCPRYKICRCFNTHRTKYITSKTNKVDETFLQGSYVVMEENDSVISFFWLENKNETLSYNKYVYEIEGGRECFLEDGVYCSINKRITQMKYIKKLDNKNHVLNFL